MTLLNLSAISARLNLLARHPHHPLPHPPVQPPIQPSKPNRLHDLSAPPLHRSHPSHLAHDWRQRAMGDERLALDIKLAHSKHRPAQGIGWACTAARNGNQGVLVRSIRICGWHRQAGPFALAERSTVHVTSAPGAMVLIAMHGSLSKVRRVGLDGW